MSFREQPAENVKVEGLNPRSRRVNLTAKVVSMNPVREVVSRNDGSSHKVTEFLVGDETGTVLLTLWDADIEKIKEGDTIDIGNAYVSLFKGQMRLNIGRFGTISPSKVSLSKVNKENNLSEKTYEQERRYSFSGQRRFGGSRGYSGGGRDRGSGGYERRGRR
ncbi:MAG: hypothetical protein QXI32_00555 [Candidatus Bathyarchaeia archaeon]